MLLPHPRLSAALLRLPLAFNSASMIIVFSAEAQSLSGSLVWGSEVQRSPGFFFFFHSVPIHGIGVGQVGRQMFKQNQIFFADIDGIFNDVSELPHIAGIGEVQKQAKRFTGKPLDGVFLIASDRSA